MNQTFENQPTYYLQSSSVPENNEGGLNINEAKSTIIRKLPLIAGVTIAMTSIAFFKTSFIPPVYVASIELLPESVNIETKVTSTDDNSGKTREEITSVELDDVQLKILKSPTVISRAVESLQDKYPELTYQSLAQDLTVEFIRNSENKKNVLSVSYEHPDKQQVADVIEVITQTYLDYSAEKRLSGVQRGIDFLDKQIPIVSSQVNKLENQLQSLRDRYNFIEPGVSLNPITDRSSLMSQEQDRIASELQQLRIKLSNLDRELRTQPTTSPTAIELATPRYQGLLAQLREIDVEIGRKSAIYSNRNAQMQVLREERQRIIGLIRQSGSAIRQKLENDIRTLENRQRVAKQESANLQSQLKSWSTVSNEYKNLESRLTLAENQLNEFTLQKDALLIDAAQQQAPWQLLSPAGEPYSNELSPSNRLFLGSTFGLLLGVGLALMLDKYQKIVYTSAKVEEITNIPVIGNIPHTPKSSHLSLLGQAKTHRAQKQLPSSDLYLEREDQEQLLAFPEFFPSSVEAFRSFAANLGLLNFSANSEYPEFDNSIKSLAITSAVSGEGKSTVALNLARASASMGKKVLLVDADVRSKVRLTESLGLESEQGLKNLLKQESPSLAMDHIKKSPLDDNLYVLTSGFDELMSSESSRLLASGQMYLLMEELKANFDLVIYDLCAIVGYADVNLLAAKTDGVVMVTGLGKVDKTMLSKAVAQLKMCNVPILGIAANNVVSEG